MRLRRKWRWRFFISRDWYKCLFLLLIHFDEMVLKTFFVDEYCSGLDHDLVFGAEVGVCWVRVPVRLGKSSAKGVVVWKILTGIAKKY